MTYCTTCGSILCMGECQSSKLDWRLPRLPRFYCGELGCPGHEGWLEECESKRRQREEAARRRRKAEIRERLAEEEARRREAEAWWWYERKRSLELAAASYALWRDGLK